jgi:hypothetical protein
LTGEEEKEEGEEEVEEEESSIVKMTLFWNCFEGGFQREDS